MIYPRLKDSVIRLVEEPLLYNYKRDEVFRLDSEALELLKHCTGRNSIEDLKKKFGDDVHDTIEYLMDESCVENFHNFDAEEVFRVEKLSTPSLRYLEIYITQRCNLRCSHCFLGEKFAVSMNDELFARIVEEFSQFGFKLLITGGEPLTHSKIWKILKIASKYPVRRILLSNGILISKDVAKKLSNYIHEVQISLDGMKKGHERIRGKDTFEKTVEGIENALEYLSVNVATVIHSENLDELDELEDMLLDMGVREWNLDFLIETGSLEHNRELIPLIEDAVRAFRNYGFGYGVHVGEERLSCGAHLCCITPDGKVTKCGYFDEPSWEFEKVGLLGAWKKITETCLPKLEELDCADCRYVSECRCGWWPKE